MQKNMENTVPAAEASQSLRSFLAELDEGQLVSYTVKREDYLLSALAQRLEDAGKSPVIQLIDPDTGERTIANTFASRDILKAHIHNIVDVEQAAGRFAILDMAEDAPVQQVVLQGDAVDLESLPVFRHFEHDAGRYITSGIVMARDPENGRVNFSFHRMQVKDKNRIGISLHSRGDLWRYLNSSEAAGKDLPVAVVIGAHPAYYITGASKVPPTQDDYSWAGAYMNEVPLVTRAKTVDIPVPARAEWVLEGRILRDEHEDEGPFGEYTGYSTSRSTRNVFVVDAITRRQDAIWQDLVPGFAWEHLLLSQFTKEIILLDKLKKEMPEVRAMSMPKNGCHFHAYLSMAPKAQGQARLAAMLLFGLDPYLKLIIVVDEDVDVYDEKEVMWAVATRMQAHRDVFIVPDVLCNRLDPSSVDGMSAKMCIDATKPDGWDAERVTLPGDVLKKADELLDNG
ncbi:UbiD family decarboxylase [Clostridia bacterium OttesenSCG-928-O13]|nr:UbiD family decarboxylase [Clostridia bacterium OttesenSCG-928-O13]